MTEHYVPAQNQARGTRVVGTPPPPLSVGGPLLASRASPARIRDLILAELILDNVNRLVEMRKRA